jgi:nitrous oxidase accessory protein NosD
VTRFKRAAAAVVVVAAGALAPVSPAAAKTRVVTPGHSIQKAIDRSKPGDTVLVEDGRYAQSLQIETDKVTLRAEEGVELRQPSKVPDTICNRFAEKPSQVVGICVVGEIAQPAGGPPEVVRPVTRVRIAGFTIRGFGGDGVFIFGGRKTLLKRTSLVENGGYGVFANASSGTRFIDNQVLENGAPGLYVGDSPKANAVVRDNLSIGNHGEGILIRSATGGRISDNVLRGNCAGVLVLADAPGPAGNWILERNSVSRNNLACAGEPDEGEPPISGIGIALLGANDTSVRDNTVVGNRRLHPSIAAGGIVIGKGVGGTDPVHDFVKDNALAGNSPFDIDYDGSGSVTFRRNDCDRSRPSGICH